MSAHSPFSIALRSLLFHLCVALITPPYAVFACLLFPLPHHIRYKWITGWTRLIIFLARFLCGIQFTIKGLNRLPNSPCILALKHSSAWETFAAQLIFPPQVWVLKRELLWIPFFGWGLWQLQPIAINRSSGARAMRQMMQQATDRIKKGLWIVVFPEGTRTRPGERVEYKSGAAHLARSLKIPMVPVAHNAGYLWPKNDWRRYPGEIIIEIGEPILPEDFHNTKAYTHHLEEWIETTVSNLGNPRL